VRCLVLLFSEKANQSEHVHREVLIADNSKKPVYPVRIENVQPSGAMKYQLANRQWLDYFEDRNRVIDELLGRIAVRRSIAAPAGGGADPRPPIAVNVPLPSEDEQAPNDDGLRRTLPPALDPNYLLFQFKGRIGRRSYVFGGLTLALALIALAALGGEVFATAPANRTLLPLMMLGVGALLFMYLFGSFALSAKRVHDFGVSAWWCLLPSAAGAAAGLASGLVPASDIFESTTTTDRILAVAFVALEIVALGANLWLLLWPGKAGANKYGPAPSFKRSWRPYDALAQRASARSEFDVPFVTLSLEGRLGAKGMIVGLLFIGWLSTVLWFFSILAGGSLYPINENMLPGFESQPLFTLFRTQVPLSVLGVLGLVATGLFAFVVFSCVVAKRLHDIGITAWVQGALSIGLVIVLTVLGLQDIGQNLIAIGIFFALAIAVLFVIPGAKNFNGYGPPPGFRADALLE